MFKLVSTLHVYNRTFDKGNIPTFKSLNLIEFRQPIDLEHFQLVLVGCVAFAAAAPGIAVPAAVASYTTGPALAYRSPLAAPVVAAAPAYAGYAGYAYPASAAYRAYASPYGAALTAPVAHYAAHPYSAPYVSGYAPTAYVH